MTALCGTLGCSHSPKTYPVSGKVTFADGTPLPGGTVEFESQAEPKVSASGEIERDGTFRVGTYQPQDGAVAGAHRVLVMPAMSSNPDRPSPDPIHPRYRSFETSGLEFTVAAEKSNSFDIKVDKPAP